MYKSQGRILVETQGALKHPNIFAPFCINFTSETVENLYKSQGRILMGTF